MRDESNHCSFCVRSKDDKSFSDILNARKKQLDCYCISDGICRFCWTWITKFGWRVDRSFMHVSTTILLGLLKHVLLENQMTDAGKIM